MSKQMTHVGVELGGDLLGLLRLVVARELVEDGPAAPPAVVVVGRRGLGVPVGIGILRGKRTKGYSTGSIIMDALSTG